MSDYWEDFVIILGAEQVRPLQENGPVLQVTGLWFTAAEYAAYDYDDLWYTEAQVGLKMDEYENIEVVSAPAPPSSVGYRILD